VNFTDAEFEQMALRIVAEQNLRARPCDVCAHLNFCATRRRSCAAFDAWTDSGTAPEHLPRVPDRSFRL
jgi:hypothetical protein